MVMSKQNLAPNDVEIGLYLSGSRVTDEDVLGQHSLFYGTVQIPSKKRFNAYVKAVSPRQIFAEVFCSLIGRSLNLPIPLTIPVIAKGESLGISAKTVMCVASLDCQSVPVGRAVRVEAVIDLLQRWKHNRTAIVFDELIANSDRHLRNVLIGSDGKLWLIDHEEALGDPLTNTHRRITNYLLKYLSQDMGRFELRRSATLLKEASFPTSNLDLDSHAEKSLPHACQVSESHIHHVIEFIRERILHLPGLIEDGLGIGQHHLNLSKPHTP